MFLCVSRCCIRCYRGFSVYPDVASGVTDVSLCIQMLRQVLQMFLCVSRCCIWCHRCFSVYPDVASGATDVSLCIQMLHLVSQMFLCVSRCCVRCYRCFSVYPDVASGATDVSLCIQMLRQVLYSCVCFLAAGICCLVSATGLSQGPLCLYNTTSGPTWGVPLHHAGYLYNRTLWSGVCLEPRGVVQWNVVLFSVMGGASGLQTLFCGANILNSLLGLVLGSIRTCEMRKHKNSGEEVKLVTCINGT
uniref:Uncharacterized protein n=1 Tax=Dicentrarchus labrax TaxID=13489 RepID=A0A8C4H7Q1_DICLA